MPRRTLEVFRKEISDLQMGWVVVGGGEPQAKQSRPGKIKQNPAILFKTQTKPSQTQSEINENKQKHANSKRPVKNQPETNTNLKHLAKPNVFENQAKAI